MPRLIIEFLLVQNNGSLSSPVAVSSYRNGASTISLALKTNAQGVANVNWTLGVHSGAGNQRVEASSSGFGVAVTFTATATGVAAALISIDSGGGQFGTVSNQLARPFLAVVTDRNHNRLEGVPVTFTVTQGDGQVSGMKTLTVNTDGSGRAAAMLTLGSEEGTANNVVQADFAGNPGRPAQFAASGLASGAIGATSISGVVLDNSNLPIPGVTMRLYRPYSGANNNVPVEVATAVATDATGQFRFAGAPVGEFKLMADGGTATKPGPWPTLEFDLLTVAGKENTVGYPIYLPSLGKAGKLCVDESSGGKVTLAEVPGFGLTVAPGSVTFPGGARSGCVSVSAVHMDKVPMVPGFGQQPRFVVTIQPVGATFNPPAALTLPNVDSLAPHHVTEMYSFDHDLNAFVAIGTATVSDDGSVVESDPGVGVLKAGWHAAGDPGISTTVGECPECQICVASGCVANPASEGKPCKGTKTAGGVCRSGKCVATSATISANYVNQDDPTNATFIQLAKGAPVFGGSEPSTSDSLMLQVTLDYSTPSVASYTWTVVGPGSSNYVPPAPSPSASQWTVGKIRTGAGTLTFKVAARFTDGSQVQATRDVEVGIRSDDTILIGWIDSSGVALPRGASPSVTRVLTVPPVPSLACNLFVADLSEGFTTPNFAVLTPIDRIYILNWLFKFAPNPDPTATISGGSFRNALTSSTDEEKVLSFTRDSSNFKLFNRLQVKYRVNSAGSFVGTPIVLHRQVIIGVTKNPCGAVSTFLLSFPGQAGPANGPEPIMASDSSRYSLINDGSPDAGAVRAFDTLTGKDLGSQKVPVFWENIGSKISFKAAGGSAPSVVLQSYPTYYEYHNGRLVNTTPQAGAPLGNFNTNPYPFGIVPCTGIGGTTPGGRCGDATTSADRTARSPNYTSP